MTSAELIKHVVEVTGLSKTDVDMRAVWLRKAGLLRKGGRGLNAEDMQASDIVNLLLGIASSKTAKGSMFTVPRYRKLVDVNGQKLGAFIEAEFVASNKSEIDSVRVRRLTKGRHHEAEAIVSFLDDTEPVAYHRDPGKNDIRFAMYREDGTISGQLLKSIALKL